jgi:hypothetical protein
MPVGDDTGLLIRYIDTDTELSSPRAYTARVRQAALIRALIRAFSVSCHMNMSRIAVLQMVRAVPEKEARRAPAKIIAWERG